MPFMLLVKGPDDEVRLLSASLSATRKDALEELARLTSDPAFSDWDAEVFVVDIDQATPVLLVRPSADPEPEASQADADLGVEVPEAETLSEDPDLTAVLRKLAEEDDASPSGVEEAALNLVNAAAAVETVDPAWAEAAMLSAGHSGEPDDESPFDLVDEIEPEPAAIAPPEPSVRQVVAQVAAEFEASGVRVPMSVRASETAEPEVADDAVELEDTATEESAAASENGSPSGPWPWSEEPTDTAEPYILPGLDEQLPEADEEQDAEIEGTATLGAEPEMLEASDFIELDDLVFAEPASPEPPGYRAEDASVQAGMSCEDCIYVETCPHKGEQDPASCGSFQWR